MPHIFISYAKKDTRPLATNLFATIEGLEGFTAWMDESLESGESWALQIQEEIDRADLVLVLLSPDVNRKPSAQQRRSFVLNEIDYAQQEHKPILPIMAVQTKMPVQIAGLEYIDFARDENAGMRRLLNRLQKLSPKAAIPEPLPKPAPSPAPSSSTVTSPKFNLPLVGAFVGLLALLIAGFIFLPPLLNTGLEGTEVVNNPTPTDEVLITEEFTESPSDTPTDEPTAADTPTDKPTIADTATDAPTEDLLIEVATVTSTTNANIRSGAGSDFGLIGTLVPGAEILVLEHSLDGQWLRVLLPEGGEGWVNISLLSIRQLRSSEFGFNPIQSALTFDGTANDDWIPYIYSGFADEVPMALVPAGCFVMGSTEEQIQYAVSLGADEYLTEISETPTDRICLNSFWLDQTEVTQADFERLGGEKTNPNGFRGDNLPVETITWFEAHTYCQRQGKRLPTEAELEYAARGVESLIFPWGNDFDSSLANYCDESCQRDGHDTANDDGHANTAPVGSYLNGASWIGALDMAGNVSEWTSSLYGNYPYSALAENNENTTGMRVLRGGSWYGTSNILRSPFRDRIYSNYTDIGVGFRCARDLEN